MEFSKQLDSAPLTEAFSFSKEKQRALHGLRGILSGVVADQTLNEKELLFLDAWLKSQQHLADEDDVRQFLVQVGEIVADGKVEPDELAGMQERIKTFIADTGEERQSRVAQGNELMGFLTGIASDGVLNDQEVTALSDWLDQHNAVRETWPASIIVDRLNNILEDGLISDEEREDLLQTLRGITAPTTNPTGISYEASTEVWEDEVEHIDIPGKLFCLTGDFVLGDRNTVDTLLRMKGAELSPNVTSRVDYLVIGTLASRDWLYTSHGRKIEKALLLRREGATITIITERSLLRFLK